MLSMDDLHMDILRFRKYLNFIDFVVLKKSLQTINAGESVVKRITLALLMGILILVIWLFYF